MKREIERGLKDELSKFKEKFELSFKNEQNALQAQIELSKSETGSLKLQLHKLEGNTFNITEQTNSTKILSDNKEIKNALKTITETQENLQKSVNNQRDDSSIISNKIKTVEEEIAKNQVKINEYTELENKIEQSVEELWKLVEGTDTENKWYKVGKKGEVIDLQEQSHHLRSEHLKKIEPRKN